MRFRDKLLLGFCTVFLAVEVTTAAVLDWALSKDLLAQVDARLLEQAEGAVRWLASTRHPERLAPRLGEVTGTRVTILDREGTVLGDSIGSGELRSGRVGWDEIRAAQAGTVGWTTRRASRLDDDVRYVAVPAGEHIVRLGLPLRQVEETRALLRSRLLWIFLASLALLAVLAVLLSRVVVSPLQSMSRTAVELARGNYAARVPRLSRDEFGQVGATFNTMAAALEGTIAELSAERTRLAKLEVVRRDFVANVSHELRTPITAIKGYVDTMLVNDVDATTHREFMSIIQRQTQRMARLVADLLRLAELDAAPVVVASAPIAIAPLLREVCETVQARAQAANVRVERHADEDLLALAESEGLSQALENLLENAIKYSGSDTTVRVGARRLEERVIIYVSDEGPGIAPEHLPRLFERFYRVDAARSRELGGTGLGLAIVKHLLEGMGGRAYVASTVGKGSTFSLELQAPTDGQLAGQKTAS